LSDQAIRFLIEQGVVLQLDKGDKLFSYGGPGDSFYIVLRGRIEILEPRGNGFIAEVEDYNTLADKIEILLNDDDLKKSFKEISYQNILENFTTEKLGINTFRVYQEVLANY
jgi:glycosyltransferase involved in cell wall biosynthesis